MESIYSKRLLLLADFLDKTTPERFDYSRWVGDDWQGKPDLSCGAKACALGWGATIPELHEAGLNLVSAYDAPSSSSWSRHGYVSLLEPLYFTNSNVVDRTGSAIQAAMKVFGLTISEAECLFIADVYLQGYGNSPDETASAKEVANHIRDFVSYKKWT